MNIVDIVLISIVIVLFIPVLFILFRNNKVAQFRRDIIEEDYKNTMERIDTGDFSDTSFRQYEKLPSYDRMLFSFKPLKKKYWL